MFIRLYFLLPNEQLTKKVITELTQEGIHYKNIHALARNETADSSLPSATKWQKIDISHIIEKFAWNINLAIFIMAFLGLVYFLSNNMDMAAISCIVIMTITFILGDAFALLTPRVHLNEFEYALRHGEVLLMVDCLKKDTARIETMVMKHHPAAIAGGSCWTINAIGL